MHCRLMWEGKGRHARGSSQTHALLFHSGTIHSVRGLCSMLQDVICIGAFPFVTYVSLSRVVKFNERGRMGR